MLKYINILLIGVGPNADRLYLPALKKIEQSAPLKLRAVVDVEEAGKDVSARLKKHNYSLKHVRTLLVPEMGLKQYVLDDNTLNKLNDLVTTKEINAVIIATEPLAHKAYTLWALSHNLPILLDKPVTARVNTAHDDKEAKGLYQDYLDLLHAYHKSTSPIFSLSVQRRYHPGFKLVFDKVQEIKDKFNIPVTSIQSLHADGQWRLPTEIITQKYHPYTVYGKISHSGYHFLDVIARLIEISYDKSKAVTKVGATTSFVEPQGLLNQLTQKDYTKLFGASYLKESTMNDGHLLRAYEGFGEVDVSSIFQLLKDDVVISNITLNLLHNSFSRRSWQAPGADLYKGNGRVKHEYHNIEQGPLQNIQIHSYQKNDRHDTEKVDNFAVGSNNHFDVYIFRNCAITGDAEPLQTFTMADLIDTRNLNAGEYIHDKIKHQVVYEFVEYLCGRIDKEDLLSSIDTHDLTVKLMSLAYESAIRKKWTYRTINLK